MRCRQSSILKVIHTDVKRERESPISKTLILRLLVKRDKEKVRSRERSISKIIHTELERERVLY